MKRKNLFVVALLLLTAVASHADNLICRDTLENRFQGTFYLVMQDRSAQQLWFADSLKNNKPFFRPVRAFSPNPANKYIKGGSEYSADVTTTDGHSTTFKLSLNVWGDQLTLSSAEESFYLSCKPALEELKRIDASAPSTSPSL